MIPSIPLLDRAPSQVLSPATGGDGVEPLETNARRVWLEPRKQRVHPSASSSPYRQFLLRVPTEVQLSGSPPPRLDVGVDSLVPIGSGFTTPVPNGAPGLILRDPSSSATRNAGPRRIKLRPRARSEDDSPLCTHPKRFRNSSSAAVAAKCRVSCSRCLLHHAHGIS